VDCLVCAAASAYQASGRYRSATADEKSLNLSSVSMDRIVKLLLLFEESLLGNL